jgi:peptidoglycan/LPS O-acetylase OafA/YrhL
MPAAVSVWGERLGAISYPLYAVHYFWTYPVTTYRLSSWLAGVAADRVPHLALGCAVLREMGR